MPKRPRRRSRAPGPPSRSNDRSGRPTGHRRQQGPLRRPLFRVRPPTLRSVMQNERCNVRSASQNRLFVYGTLIPTEPAWSVVAPYAVDHRPDSVVGALFDTTWGFPALSLDPRHRLTVVPGAVIWLDPALVDRALADL